MFTKKIFALLVITLVVLMSAASEIRAQETKTFKVDAKQKMVDTGVKINKGDIIEVTSISGTFFYNKDHKGYSYEGNTNTTKSDPGYFEYGNAAEHSLVMWIGDKNNHFQVRKNIATEANTSGNLFFAINDGKTYYKDNIGGYDVTYKIVTNNNGGKVCSPRTNEKVDVKWVNKTGKPIRVNWINFDCTEEKSDRLIQPGKIFDGYSFTNHVFRVRDEASNADLGLIVVKPAIATFNIVK